MLQFKIIGLCWSLLCLIALVLFSPHLWSMAGDPKYGIGSGFEDAAFWMLHFLAEAFLMAGTVSGFGLLRLKRWAAISTRVVATIALLYCLSFALMSHFRFAWIGLFGAAFAAYSLLVVCIFRPYDRAG